MCRSIRQRLRPTPARLLATLAIASVSVFAGFLGDIAGGLLVMDRFAGDDDQAANPELWAEVFEAADEVAPHLDEVTDFVTSMQDAESDGLFVTFEKAEMLSRWVTIAIHLLLSYLVACFAVQSPRTPCRAGSPEPG